MRISFVGRRIGPSGTSGEREPSAGLMILVLAIITFSALNLIRLAYIHDPALKIPPALGYVTGITLLFAAGVVAMRLLGRETKDWLALPILLGMTAMCAWVAIAGNQSCRSTSSLLLPRVSCRAGFGVGAALLLLMVVVLVRGWWRRSREHIQSA